MNKLKDAVSKWSFLSITGFISWLVIVGSLSFLTFTSTSSLWLWLLFGFTGLPLIILATVYAYRALHNKKFGRIIVYPFIDLFRVLSFCFGQLSQLFKKTRKQTT